jgi:hypothetical protein
MDQLKALLGNRVVLSHGPVGSIGALAVANGRLSRSKSSAGIL